GQGYLPDHPPAQPRAGRDHDAGGAERPGGARGRRLWLRHGTRTHRHGRYGGAAVAIEGRAGILPRRPDGGYAARPETLEAEEDMAMTVQVRHPGQGREATAELGPIGRKIVWRGPVLVLPHFSTVARTCDPAVLLNGSRLCGRFATLSGMTAASGGRCS